MHTQVDDPATAGRGDVSRRRLVQLGAAALVLLLVVGAAAAVPLLGMRADIATMQEDLAAQRELTNELLDGIGDQLAITRQLADTAQTLDGRTAALQEDADALHDIASDLRVTARGLRDDIVPRLDEALAIARQGLDEAQVLREGTFERLDTLLSVADQLLAEIRLVRTGAFARLDTTIDIAREVLDETREINRKIPESTRAIP